MRTQWPPSDEAFQAFLAWLSPDREEAGTKFEQLKKQLIRFFTQRGCRTPDELFYETVARAANKIHSGAVDGSVDPIAYCYGMAKYVYLESLRVPDPDPMPLDPPSKNPEPGWDERELACLDGCLGRLNEHDRTLVCRYYEFQGREKIEVHKKMAAEEGGPNVLRIRVFRIRNTLRECVFRCVNHGAVVAQ